MRFQKCGQKETVCSTVETGMIKNRFHKSEKHLGEVKEFAKTMNLLSQ